MAVFKNQGLGAMIMQVAQTQLSFQAQRQQMQQAREQMKMQVKEQASLQQMRLENVRLQDQNFAIREEQFEFQKQQATTAAEFSKEKFKFQKDQSGIDTGLRERGLELQERGLDIREQNQIASKLQAQSNISTPNVKNFLDLQDRVRDNKVGRFFAGNQFPGITSEKSLQDRLKTNQNFLTRISENSSQAEMMAAILSQGGTLSEEERSNTEALRSRALRMKDEALQENQRLQNLIRSPGYNQAILSNLDPKDYEAAQVPMDSGTAQLLSQFEFTKPPESSAGVESMPQGSVLAAVTESIAGNNSKLLNIVMPQIDTSLSQDEQMNQLRGVMIGLMRSGVSKADAATAMRQIMPILQKGN